MNLKKTFMAVATLLCVATTMVAQQMPPVPADPEFRVGRLENGMTYYLRHNNWPENRAEFYIAQRVGSIQEDDNQRGLAHFVEHMAFHGSKHFKGNEVQRWFAKVGLKLGRDFNSYTSVDRTVYNVSNVPTTRQSVLDSCLLFLYDCADGLLLESEEIEKERWMLHEGWRHMHASVQLRMLERNLPALYPNSKYGHRIPSGSIEIIDKCQPQLLRDFYKKWYRPDNQALIIVGDIDVDQTEKKIKDLFSQIATPGPDAAQVVEEAVPDNAEPIVVVDKDKEMALSYVSFMVKSDPLPRPLRATMAGLIQNHVINAVTSMLNDRLTEAAKKADCPFVQASASYGTYLLSSPKDQFSIDVVAKEGQSIEAAMKAAIIEAHKAAQSGFSEAEYKLYKDKYTSQLENRQAQKDKQHNSSFVNQCLDNFLEGHAMPSIDFEHQAITQLQPKVIMPKINQLLPEKLGKDYSNLVVLNFNQEKKGAVYPTRESLLAAIKEARRSAHDAPMGR